MKNIKPESAWITGIPAFARFSCSAFENFLCAGTLLVPRVHCYTVKACTSSGQQMWEQGKQGGKQPLSSFEKHLSYAYSHRNYVAILVTLHMLVESRINCAEPVWQASLQICLLLPPHPMPVPAPFWSLSLLPSSLFSVKPSSDWGSVYWYRSGSTAR